MPEGLSVIAQVVPSAPGEPSAQVPVQPVVAPVSKFVENGVIATACGRYTVGAVTEAASTVTTFETGVRPAAEKASRYVP